MQFDRLKEAQTDPTITITGTPNEFRLVVSAWELCASAAERAQLEGRPFGVPTGTTEADDTAYKALQDGKLTFRRQSPFDSRASWAPNAVPLSQTEAKLVLFSLRWSALALQEGRLAMPPAMPPQVVDSHNNRINTFQALGNAMAQVVERGEPSASFTAD